MGRNVFISFLGTTNYKEEKYYINNDTSTALSPMRFSQEAILKHHCSHFNQNDTAYIFLTSDARKKNWEDFEHLENPCTKEKALKKGLKNSLLAMNLPFLSDINNVGVSIKNGNSEDEIWEIFQQIYDCLEPNDCVYFDITHGFRSSPMLTLTLINYAKFLKNIEVMGIYYGAFEAGDRKEKLSPIWNLVSFSIVQEYTTAANIFMKYGNSNALSEITQKELKPLLKGENEKTDTARDINKFINSLMIVTDSLQTNRGQDLVEGNIFKNLQLNLSKISDSNFIVPMKPILEKVSEKVKNFNTESDWKNGFQAVRWCIEHNLIQQGITMLQESLLTYYCIQFDLNYKVEGDRNLIAACFYIKNKGLEDDINEWSDLAKINKIKVIRIIENIPKELAGDYDSLTKGARNDINHGGFSKNENPQKLKRKLIKSFDKIKLILDI
jgi:CRISPR-associated Csx2 family protein